MTNLFKTTLFAGAMAALVLSGCKKNSDSPATPAAATPSSSAPSVTVNDGYGAMAAVKSVSYVTYAGYTTPVEVNTAVAVFMSAQGATTYVDAGTVTLNTKALTKSTANAYVYQTLTDPLSFGQFNWNVSGSSSVPAISYNNPNPMADFSGYNSLPSTVTKANGVTITLGSSVSDADSVYVVVADYNNHRVMKRLAGYIGQCTIAASELSGFTAGQGMVQVCPWNYRTQTFSGKKFYFINESAYTKMGITIN